MHINGFPFPYAFIKKSTNTVCYMGQLLESLQISCKIKIEPTSHNNEPKKYILN